MLGQKWLRLSVGFLALLIAALLWKGAAPAARAAADVLILGPTVSGGMSSPEAQAAIALGLTVEVVDDAGWGAKTTADFASYKAIILGDPDCGSSTAIAAAEANKSVWGPAINGNVVIIGTDPVYHQFVGVAGAGKVTEKGIAFATNAAGKTGAYITLSCYYHGTAPGTPVPLLDAFSLGGFTVTGVGCYNDAHIVATHPALSGLTDADLSNWNCSVHEAFDKWPDNFLVLAIARDIGSSYTAPDGTVGTPYILARGEGLTVISDIRLAPASATNPVGASHTLTATVMENSLPTAGRTVTFTVVSGPNAGLLGTRVTDAGGSATLAYTSVSTGTDSINASFVDGAGRTQTSNRVTKVWVAASPSPTPTPTATPTQTPVPSGATLRAFLVRTQPGGYAAAGTGFCNSGDCTGAAATTIGGIPAGSTVTDAFLYWNLITDAAPPATSGGLVNGQTVRGDLIASQAVIGVKVGVYRGALPAAALPAGGNGTYSLSGFPASAAAARGTRITLPSGGAAAPATRLALPSGAAAAQGAEVVLLYRNAALPTTSVVINDGLAVVGSGSAPEPSTAATTLGGFSISGAATFARTTYVVADAGLDSQSAAGFNGATVATNPFKSSSGQLWDSLTADVRAQTPANATSGTASVTNGGPVYLLWVAQVYGVRGTAGGPQLFLPLIRR
jgi:hypothetical protein